MNNSDSLEENIADLANQGVPATFVCWHCGAKKQVLLPANPQFAFEIARWANEAGMFGTMDLYHSRALIFCSEEHANNEKTRVGHYRLRPKGPAIVSER